MIKPYSPQTFLKAAPFLVSAVTCVTLALLFSPLPAHTKEYSVSSKTDLESALNAAAAGDRIKLDSDIQGTASYIINSAGIVLDGNGHTLNSESNTGPAFTFTPGSHATLSNMTISNAANTSGKGGAVLVNGAKVSMSGMVFENNSTEAPQNNGDFGGGALRLAGASGSSFENSSFINNAARPHPANGPGSGGAVYMRSTNDISFAGSTFTGNSADTMGGAIAAAFGSSNFNANNTTFQNNSTRFEGGAIAAWYMKNGTFRHALFSGNKSTDPWGEGGAVHLIGGTDIDFTGARFLNNTARGNGGALFIRVGKNLNFAQTLFKGNLASEGGAIYLAAIPSSPITGLDFTGAVFENNSAEFAGGALSVLGGAVQDLTLVGTTFLNNTAEYGGAIYAEDDITLKGNTLFSGNTAKTGEGGAIIAGGNLNLIADQNETIAFATASDTIYSSASMIKLGRGRVKLGADVTVEGKVEVREGEMIVTGDAIVRAKDFLLHAGSTLGLTLSAQNNPIIRLDSSAGGGTGLMESGSNFYADLKGEAAALKGGESMDVAVLSGAVNSTAGDFAPNITINNLLYAASGKFAGDTWYVTLSRQNLPEVLPDLPPDIGGSVEDDYNPGDNPWLDDVLDPSNPDKPTTSILSGVQLPALVHTFYIVQDISGMLRGAATQGAEWGRRQGGKVWISERGSLWFAPLFLHDKARNMPTSYGLKGGYTLNMGGSVAGIDLHNTSNTFFGGGVVALGAGRLTSHGDFLRTTNAVQFLAGSVYGEWRPAALHDRVRLGLSAGFVSTENSLWQRGKNPLSAQVYARALQLDAYAEHRQTWGNWELRSMLGAGAVWYYRAPFHAKAVKSQPGQPDREVDVAEYTESRELTLRIPVRLELRRAINTQNGVLTPSAYVGYQPVLGDRAESYKWKLMDGRHPVRVKGPLLDRHNVLAGFSLMWENKQSKVSLSWDAEFSRHRKNHSLGVTFTKSF